MQRVRITATGRVQGVFFRASLREEAERLGLTGWARNLPDGSVQAEVQGPEDAVARAVAFCERGPGHAVVSSLEVTPLLVLETESSFVVQ